MKKINKIISRIFFGGADVRLGMNVNIPISRIAIYMGILFSILFINSLLNPITVIWNIGLFTQIVIGLIGLVAYINFIHFRFFPVKWEDLSDYQKWQFGNGILFGNGGLKNNLTEEQLKEWKELDKKVKQ